MKHLALVPNSRFSKTMVRGYDRFYLDAKNEKDARKKLAFRLGQGKCPDGTIVYMHSNKINLGTTKYI